MSANLIPLNTWLSIPETWRPQQPVASSIAQKFLFHHIRPLTSLSLMPFAMGFKNDVQSIAARQISIIAGIKQDVFVCVTATGPMLDKYNGRYSAGDYQTYLRNHQAAIWHIPFNNLFQGPYEAFNGPNAIDITSAH